MSGDPAGGDRPGAVTAGPAGPARVFAAAGRLGPGLGLVACGVVVAWLLNRLLPPVSPLMFALLLGAVVANLGVALDRFQPGIRLAGKRLLRAGIVLLGLRLSIMDVLGLGWRMLVVVVLSVAATFLLTLWVAARLRLSPARGLLIATGVSICGASAVAAMSAVTDADEEDVMSTVALITLCGSAAIVVLPLVAAPLELSVPTYGQWAGASVHEVAQVVAAAGVVGAAAIAPAVVVKLTRVLLLAPLVAGVLLWRRRTARVERRGERPPLVPLFIVGFLAAVCLRSAGVLPAGVLSGAELAQTALLSAGMFGLGASVRLRSLLRASGPSLATGLAASVVLAAVSLAGILVVA